MRGVQTSQDLEPAAGLLIQRRTQQENIDVTEVGTSDQTCRTRSGSRYLQAAVTSQCIGEQLSVDSRIVAHEYA